MNILRTIRRILRHATLPTRARRHEVRGQNDKANSLREVAIQTAKLWRKHHLTYEQTKHVVEQTRRELGVEAPRERRRTVERLDRVEVERLIESAYGHSSQYGFMVKMLFYTGARVSEFVQTPG
jgi:integrase/recombinase XerD